MGHTSSLMFGPAVVDDIDGADIAVDVRTAGQVRISTGPEAIQRAHLDPDGARAIARALLEAADVAEELTFEDTGDNYPSTENAPGF